MNSLEALFSSKAPKSWQSSSALEGSTPKPYGLVGLMPREERTTPRASPLGNKIWGEKRPSSGDTLQRPGTLLGHLQATIRLGAKPFYGLAMVELDTACFMSIYFLHIRQHVIIISK